jgi:hypothetical protein
VSGCLAAGAATCFCISVRINLNYIDLFLNKYTFVVGVTNYSLVPTSHFILPTIF